MSTTSTYVDSRRREHPYECALTVFPWDTSFVEVNLFIICGSMPTFRKFLHQFASRLMGSTGTSSDPSKPQSNTHDTSQSRLRREELSGYSQLDTVGIDDNECSEDGNREVPLGTTICVTGAAGKYE